MVVGITLATIALLRSRSGGGISFVDAESFREQIEKHVEGPERRSRALTVIDSMTALAAEYDEALRRTLDAYLEITQDYSAQPSQIIESTLGPLETRRRSVLLTYFDLRAQLRDALLEAEWDEVFGE